MSKIIIRYERDMKQYFVIGEHNETSVMISGPWDSPTAAMEHLQLLCNFFHRFLVPDTDQYVAIITGNGPSNG